MKKTAEFAELIADVREQVLYLQELGVEGIEAELVQIVTAPADMVDVSSVGSARAPAAAIPNIPTSNSAAERKPAGSLLFSLPTLSSRAVSPSKTEMQAPSSASISTQSALVIIPEIANIRADIGDCTRCPLHTGRTQIVHSTGNFHADLMFVGEAPGADEDEQGFPFVGRAGQLLTKIIEGIGISREDVFIGNINRCRPPGNRAPEPEETAACKPFLLREIEAVEPKVIVVLGATAAHNLLETKVPIGKLRGQFHDYLGVKVMPTFHPAYLLRDPHKKREVWEDMKLVRDYLVEA